MKEIIIMVIILCIILGGDILICKYLKFSSQRLVVYLEDIEEQVKNSEDITDIKQKAEKCYKDWKETQKYWSMLVLHSELDSIGTSLIKMKVDIEEDKSMFLEELKTSIFLINHIYEKEKFCLKNII